SPDPSPPWHPPSWTDRIIPLPPAPLPACSFSTRDNPPRRSAMRCLSPLLILVALPVGARAADPGPDVQTVIDPGLASLARDNVAWKLKRKCAECHHAPFTIWALNEGKKRGYAVDEKALAELTSWVVDKDYLSRLFVKPPKQEQV